MIYIFNFTDIKNSSRVILNQLFPLCLLYPFVLVMKRSVIKRTGIITLKTNVIDLVRNFNDDIGDAMINLVLAGFFVQLRYPLYARQNVIVLPNFKVDVFV